jgi:hypothetical protein
MNNNVFKGKRATYYIDFIGYLESGWANPLPLPPRHFPTDSSGRPEFFHPFQPMIDQRGNLPSSVTKLYNTHPMGSK